MADPQVVAVQVARGNYMMYSRFTDALISFAEIAFYAGTAVTAYLALRSPVLYTTFLGQSFEFWMVSEFLAIHSTGMLSAHAREKFGTRVVLSLSAFYLIFMMVVTIIFSQWVLGAFMLGMLAVRATKTLTNPQSAGIDLFIRTLVFLFTLFTAGIVIHFFGILIPDLVSTSDPAYMELMGKSGFVIWVVEYYGILALIGVVLMAKQVFKKHI